MKKSNPALIMAAFLSLLLFWLLLRSCSVPRANVVTEKEKRPLSHTTGWNDRKYFDKQMIRRLIQKRETAREPTSGGDVKLLRGLLSEMEAK